MRPRQDGGAGGDGLVDLVQLAFGARQLGFELLQHVAPGQDAAVQQVLRFVGVLAQFLQRRMGADCGAIEIGDGAGEILLTGAQGLELLVQTRAEHQRCQKQRYEDAIHRIAHPRHTSPGP